MITNRYQRGHLVLSDENESKVQNIPHLLHIYMARIVNSLHFSRQRQHNYASSSALPQPRLILLSDWKFAGKKFLWSPIYVFKKIPFCRWKFYPFISHLRNVLNLHANRTKITFRIHYFVISVSMWSVSISIMLQWNIFLSRQDQVGEWKFAVQKERKNVSVKPRLCYKKIPFCRWKFYPFSSRCGEVFFVVVLKDETVVNLSKNWIYWNFLFQYIFSGFFPSWHFPSHFISLFAFINKCSSTYLGNRLACEYLLTHFRVPSRVWLINHEDKNRMRKKIRLLQRRWIENRRRLEYENNFIFVFGLY